MWSSQDANTMPAWPKQGERVASGFVQGLRGAKSLNISWENGGGV